MQSLRRRIRRDFAPLTVSVSLVVESAFSPTTQVFDIANGGYEPNREMTPTVIRPVVTAEASDGSWNPSGTEIIADPKWYVNGKDISTLPEWVDKYEIVDSGANKGQISIKKNMGVSEQASLHFEAEVPDYRLGINVPVISDPIILYTFDKGFAGYSIEIANNQNVLYNPFKDRLFRYQYQVAHGIKPVESDEAAATDGNSYIQKFPIKVYNGRDEMAADSYTLEFYHFDNSAAKTLVTAADDEIVAMSNTGITLDLRLIEKAEYLIVLKVDGKDVFHQQFAVCREYPAFRLQAANGTSINEGDEYYYNVILVNSYGRNIKNPESIIKILWKTDTAAKKGVVHNEGATTSIRLADTGIGSDSANSWLDIYADGTQKPAHAVATDKDGNEYTDGANGEILIFN